MKETVLSRSVRLRLNSHTVQPLSIALFFGGSMLAVTQALAQLPSSDEAAHSGPAVAPSQSVVVTGSRFGRSTVTDSSTPIDVIAASEIANSGHLQLQQSLKTLVPSFSVSNPATTGATDFTTAPTLRGLGPGELLLMVNGKRRHSTGILNISNVIGRGDVAYDFSTVPTAALSRVEVLRDGASAQYGADAIAGVINMVLDKSIGSSASVVTGMNAAGDGAMVELNGSSGVVFGGDGVVRTSVRVQKRNESNTAAPDTRQQYFGSGGTRPISGNYGSGTGLTPSNGTLDPREATIDRNLFRIGEAAMRSGAVFINAEKPYSDTVTLYAFGGYSQLEGDTPGFYRRAGQDEVVRALHPDGFRPNFATTLANASFVAGARGTELAGFAWDVSTAYGRSLLDVSEENSNNVSYGSASPTSAYTGGTRFGQWTTNLDVNREFELGQGAPLKFATGLEFRKEYFRRTAGEPMSYANGGVPILDGPNAGKPAMPGMQPTAGTTPDDAVNAQRHSSAAYIELERQLNARWLLTGAGRVERFSDFGSSRTYKLASRFKVSEQFALRGSVSTGFRAPNLAQSFTSTTSTTFLLGNPVTLRLLPVNNPIARILGATDLKPEESHDISMGGVFNEGGLTLALDAYRIDIADRLGLSSTFQDTRVTQLLASRGFPGVGAVSYMSNAIDTRTEGIDLSGTYRFKLGEMGSLTLNGAANHSTTSITRVAATPTALSALGITTPLYDLTQQVRLTDASPHDKVSLGLGWKRGNWAVNLNNTYYGEVALVAYSSLTPAQIAAISPGSKVETRPTNPASGNAQLIQRFGAKIVTDVNASYQFGKALLTLGANNLLDVYPDKNVASSVAGVAANVGGADNAGTLPYPLISPFPYTGRAIYAKLSYKF
jgi:iron complex outermembrane receptor protein